MSKCPECGKPALERFAPFCCGRCQQIDLGRWLKGDYVISGTRSEPGGTAPSRADDDEAE